VHEEKYIGELSNRGSSVVDWKLRSMVSDETIQCINMIAGLLAITVRKSAEEPPELACCLTYAVYLKPLKHDAGSRSIFEVS
jgi:hypothetical protein